MKRNYAPSGKLERPVLTLHDTNDGATMVTYESAYADTVASAGRASLLRQVFVKQAGHCNFEPGEVVTSLVLLDHRIEHGEWPDTQAEAMVAQAHALGFAPTHFIDFKPRPFLRPCTTSQAKCAGEP